MNILITGGVGFIGTNCALFFSRKNRVAIIDNFSRSGVKFNADHLKKYDKKIKIIESDLVDTEKYLGEIKKADAIIHLAGQTAVTTSIKNPALDFKSNILGSFKLSEAARTNNPKAVLLYSSTNKVYGDLDKHKIVINSKNKCYEDICHPQGLDESEGLDFISPYGCSKGATDLYFLDYARIYDLNTVVFRQSCIYGDFQIGVEDQGWVAHFTKQFLQAKPITIFGDGYQVRDLLYIKDLVSLYDLAIKKIAGLKGQAFNIGGGIKNAYSLRQVIDLIQTKTKNNVKVNFQATRLGDQKYFVSANKKVKKYLNWQPSTDFKVGLQKLISWQHNNLAI